MNVNVAAAKNYWIYSKGQLFAKYFIYIIIKLRNKIKPMR